MKKMKSKKSLTEKEIATSTSNKQIVIITYIVVFIFLGLMGYITKFMLIDSGNIINNVYNPRQEILEVQNRRGQILSKDGDVLASTIIDKNGEEVRVYPYQNLFSHVVGYSTKGKTGIEALGNFYLLNSHESMPGKLKNDLSGIKNQGDNIVTTLDVDIQKVASEALGSYQGAIIVLEPSTGKVLAMVSNPNFNPNEINDIWEDLSKDTESSVLLNRATLGLYPPGSTFKILTALEYIRENPDTYDDYSFTCTGNFQYNDDKIKCYQGKKHGDVNLSESFAHSCNSSFANIGLSLDKEKFSETLYEMLFGSKLPIELNYNKSSVAVNNEISDGLMMQISIGQGATQVTPLHMAMITSTIANGGKLMNPYFIEKIENFNGSYVKKISPVTYGTLMSKTESTMLTNMMAEVVASGTADTLMGLEYKAAGKTGSAEYNTNKGDSHAWFTGFAPYDNPQIVVTIIVEGAGSGGDYAVPIGKQIFDAYFEKYGILEK